MANQTKKEQKPTKKWHFRYRDKRYLFDMDRHITVGSLRQFKEWFGSDYGKFYTLRLLWLQMDVDAVFCAVWAALITAGEAAPEPSQIDDFSLGGFLEELEPVEEFEDESERPTKAATPTPGMTETPADSETTTSDD